MAKDQNLGFKPSARLEPRRNQTEWEANKMKHPDEA